MKRSVIFILIVSLFLISACNDHVGTPSINIGSSVCCVVSDVNTNNVIGCSGSETNNLECDLHYSNLGNTEVRNAKCNSILECQSTNCFGYDSTYGSYNIENEAYKCGEDINPISYDLKYKSYYCDAGSISLVEDCLINKKICEPTTGSCITPESPLGLPIPRLYMTFDDGTATDLSGYENNGLLMGAIISNGVLLTNGITNYILILPSRSLYFDYSLTMAAWINPLEQTAGYKNIIDKNTKSDVAPFSQYSMNYAYNYNGIIEKPQFAGRTGNVYASSNSAPINQWTYVIITYGNGQAKIYINGILNNIADISGDLNLTTSAGSQYPITLGAGINAHGVARPFIGSIDNVRIYNETLTAEQVNSLFTSECAQFNKC